MNCNTLLGEAVLSSSPMYKRLHADNRAEVRAQRGYILLLAKMSAAVSLNV